MIGYTPTPDYYNDYLAHYGVMGMKWGIRKDLRNAGQISAKTKKKIKKAISKASYRKTRRMLNGLEDLKSDYRSKIEEYKGDKKTNRAKEAKNHLSKIEGVQSQWKSSAKKKKYNYDTKKDFTRYSSLAKKRTMMGSYLGGTLGAVGVNAYQNYAHKKYTDQTRGKTSKYIDTSGVYYKKKRR